MHLHFTMPFYLQLSHLHTQILGFKLKINVYHNYLPGPTIDHVLLPEV